MDAERRRRSTRRAAAGAEPRRACPAALTKRQFEDALKLKVDVVIPDLPKVVGQAATLGKPAGRGARPVPGGDARSWSTQVRRPERCWTRRRMPSCRRPRPSAALFGRQRRAMSGSFGRRRPGRRAGGARAGAPRGQRCRPQPRLHRAAAGRSRSCGSCAWRQLEPSTVTVLSPERLERGGRSGWSASWRRERRVHAERRGSSGRWPTELVHDMLGLGPLEPLLEDDTHHRHHGQRPAPRLRRAAAARPCCRTCGSATPRTVANVCQRIAVAVGRRVDESSPMVDARLKDGRRVNIVFPPLALDGPYVSIRKFSQEVDRFERWWSSGR